MTGEKVTIAWMANYVMGQGWLAMVRREKMNITAIRERVREVFDSYELPEEEQDYSVEEVAQYVWHRAWGR